jgi:integrase
VNHHASLPYGDVPKFLTAVRGATMEASVKLAFEFLILTSTRTSEVLGARWDEFNLKDKDLDDSRRSYESSPNSSCPATGHH